MLIEFTEQEVTMLKELVSNGYAFAAENDIPILENIDSKLNPSGEEPEEDAQPVEAEHIPGEDMDGDFDSAMASAGFGTDEDYDHGSTSDE